MSNSVKIDLSLQDQSGSINKRTNEVKGLNKELTKSQQLATGTKTGAVAVKASYSGPNIPGSTPMTDSQYNQARGAAGSTGAAGRDFANQSQGLGGLVRLYATYAANLFAVGAAFRALSEAADTTNMVQGMNQLGATSGLALGNIAKSLVKATDGAISMREAMEATTKGTAAGLSAKQMEQLGQVANKASKALGIGMPDAISRLSRGISKLEPELLDELGLFTKIGPATENYARSLGKSTASLTDFERRQAFANAVLKEGIDKFGSIDIAANPYDKLLATLKDLSFKALEVVNKAFVPLISILSQNPTALLGVLAAIGVSIVKTAIPALGNYRENLKKTADESRRAFSMMYSNQQEAYSNLAQEQAVTAERAFKNTKSTQDKLQKLSQEGKGFTKSKRVDYGQLASKDPFELTAAEIKSLDARAKYLATKNAQEASMLTKHVASIKAIRAQLSDVGDTAAAKAIESSEKIYSTAVANDIINKRKLQTVATQTIRSNVAEMQSTLGMRAAWQKLNQDLDAAKQGFLKVQTGIDENGKAIMQNAPKLDRFQVGYTKFAGGLGIGIQKIGTTVQAFGAWGLAIGAAIGAFSMLDSWMTKTEKESDTYNKAIAGMSDAIDNTTRTLAALAKQPGIATATIQGFLALSNASHTTTSAIEEQLDATKALLQALNSSLWDRAKNNIAGLFGKDIESQAAESLANTVQSQLKVFRAAGIGVAAEESFKKSIGVNSLDVDTVTEAFKKSTDAQDAFAKSNKKLDIKLLESSSNLQSFKTATDAVTKAYEEFIQSTASTNPMFKIGTALEDLSAIMQKIATSDIADINAAFNDLADNPKKIAQFGKPFVDQFVATRQEFKTTLQEYSAYGQSLAAIQDQIALKTEEKKKITKSITRREGTMLGGRTVVVNADEQRAEQDKTISLLRGSEKIVSQLQTAVSTETFVKAKDLFTKGITDSFVKGSDLIEKALGQSAQKAALTVAQAGIGALSGALAAQETGKLKQEEIKIQLQQVQTTIDLIASNSLLTATMTESNALMAVAQARDSNAPAEEKSEAGAALIAAKIFKDAVGQVSAGTMKTSQLESILTGNPQVDKYIKQQLMPLKRATAQQTATATELGGKSKATTIETARASNLGNLEDLNKQRTIVNDINQQLSARVDILTGIDTLNSSQRVNDKTILENLISQSKQLQEIDGYETAIKNAKALGTVEGEEQAKKLRILLELAKARQRFENDNKGLIDRIKFQAAELADVIKLNALKESVLDQNIAIKNTIASIVGFSTEQTVQEVARLENIKLQSKFAFELEKIQNNINILLTESGQVETKSVALAREELSLAQTRQALEKDNKGLQDALKLLESRVSLEKELAGFRKTAADAQSQQAEDELNYKKQYNLITDDQAIKEKANIDRTRQAREYQKDLNDLLDKENRLKIIGNAIDEMGPGISERQTELMSQYLAGTEALKEQRGAVEANNAQKVNAIKLTESLSSRQIAYGNIFENSFNSMADALVTWAETGKLSGKQLFNSLIADLARYELKLQAMEMYKSARPGLMNIVGSFFGQPGGSNPTMEQFVDNSGGRVFAKGGAFDYGVEAFAKGGMFTNSVVNSPTLFKAAKGLGVMGEAGPEAIMPLKRDANGNLGVRAGNSGGNTEVVVNNYSTAQATTQETTDSRGNRKIEVIIGEAASAEMARSGSNSQGAMRSTYGLAPQLIRR